MESHLETPGDMVNWAIPEKRHQYQVFNYIDRYLWNYLSKADSIIKLSVKQKTDKYQ
jgi:hypothetical protein